MKILYMKLLLFCILGVFIAANVQATIIDLKEFYADPTVKVDPDGISAKINEDPSKFHVLLSNDPGLGDKEVIKASAGVTLSFDYEFIEGLLSNDEFEAFVLNSSGASAGPGYDFYIQDSNSGTVSFDLSGLTGESFIGLQFQLSSLNNDHDLNSVVTVSNVRLEDGSGIIPEPSTILLFVVGGIGFATSVIRTRFK